MANKLKETLLRIVRRLHLGAIVLYLHPRSALRQRGWYRSFAFSRPVDKNGNAIPWFSYSFIHFLETRLQSTFRVFEYGCGNSTLWFARRVREVVAVENNERWAGTISPLLPGNARVVLRPLADDYSREVLSHGKFDIVIVDGGGGLRLSCGKAAVEALQPSGVIIWDDSATEGFRTGFEYLRQQGFREIAFCGLGPQDYDAHCTSLLYRPDNCLGV